MHSKNVLRLAPLAAVCAALPVLAQTVETGVVPDAGLNTTDGSTSGTTPLASTARTSQVLIDSFLLGQIPPGSVITSIAFRLDASVAAAWPAAATSFADYEIRVGKPASNAPGMSTTFSNNVVPGSEVLVRDGLLAPIAGIFTAAAVPPNAEAFGPAIAFQSGYYYTGGGLVITIRHSGQSGGGTSATVDAHATAGIAHAFANGQGAASGLITAAAPIIRIGFVRDTSTLSDGVNKLFVGEEFATNEGTSQGTVHLFSANPRTVGTIVAASELDTLAPGTSLTGVSMRNRGTATVPANGPWPAADRTFNSWSLQLASSEFDAGDMSTTAANNAGPDAVTVYNNPLIIPAEALLPDASPNTTGIPAPFSFVVPFHTRFEYRGGPLFMLHRTSGHGQGDLLQVDRAGSPRIESRLSNSQNAVLLGADTIPALYRFDADAAVIAPNINTKSDANSVTSQILSATNAMYQLIIHESELTHIPVGSIINSFALRRQGGQGSSWPPADAAVLDYEVWVSTAARTPNTMSSTFATNEGADKMQVRDGALGVPANSYPSSGPGAQPYGPAIRFQRGFVYKGGSLCLTVRTTGLTSVPQPHFTGQLGSPLVRSVTVADPNGLAGAFSAGPVIKIGYIASGVTNAGPESGGRYLFDANRTNQIIYSASALADIPPGSRITGMTVRNQTSNPNAFYPATDTVLPRFDVALSTAVNTPSFMSDVVADNEGADRIDARTGPLVLPAGALKESPILPAEDEDEFDFYINFSQAFFYRGGDLCVTIRSQSPLVAPQTVAATSTSDLVAMRRVTNSADAAVLNPSTLAPIIRFAYTPPSLCPADLNKDGVVNDEDFQIFVLAYNTLDCNDPFMAPGCPADLNFDGIVDDLDFQIFVLAYDALLCP